MALDNVITLFTNRHLESTEDACQHILGQDVPKRLVLKQKTTKCSTFEFSARWNPVKHSLFFQFKNPNEMAETCAVFPFTFAYVHIRRGQCHNIFKRLVDSVFD